MTDLPFDLDRVRAFLDGATEAQAAGTEADDPLDALVARFAALDAEPGSVVMIVLPNGLRLLRTFFAVCLAGHTPVLLAPSTPPRRVKEVAHQLGAHALVRANLRPDDHGVTPVAEGDDLAVFGGRNQAHGPGHAILMSSGTSGLAVGCLHSLEAMLRNASRHADSIGQRAGDTVMVSLPMYYSFALVAQVLGCLATGSRLVIAGPPFTVANYRATIARHGVTVSSLTPILAKSLVGNGEELPPPLRTLSVGGQALDPGYTSRLLKVNPALELYVTYGLTEAGPRVSTLAAHREPPHRHGSVGLPIDGVSLSTRAAPGGQREILVRSDTVYRYRVGEAAPSKRGDLLEPGLLATGDIGHVDDDGYLHLAGRSSDFMTVRGEKVSTAGLRKAAESLPHVVRAAAELSGTDPDSAQLTLHVHVDETAAVTEADVHERLRAILTRHERPHVVRIHASNAERFK